MISKAKIKHIRKLHRKKIRHQQGLYIIEGEKIILEYLQNDINLVNVYAHKYWKELHTNIFTKHNLTCNEISEKELNQISVLKTPSHALAIAKIPTQDNKFSNKGLHLVLDDIQDPGNLGTMIRLADWFKLSGIICSENCVDAYNAKTVQATMGSLPRVKIQYKNLGIFLPTVNLPIYATTLLGKSIYQTSLAKDGIILIGNESKGIQDSLLAHATHQISIPRFGKAESLNAAVAAGIIVAKFRE